MRPPRGCTSCAPLRRPAAPTLTLTLTLSPALTLTPTPILTPTLTLPLTPTPTPSQDEEGLRQIARVVADRGARARAVQIGIFPKGDERMAADARPALLPLRPGQAVAGTAFSFIP